MITLHFHLIPQYKYELFHIYFTILDQVNLFLRTLMIILRFLRTLRRVLRKKGETVVRPILLISLANLRPIYTVRLCSIRQAYDRPTT